MDKLKRIATAVMLIGAIPLILYMLLKISGKAVGQETMDLLLHLGGGSEILSLCSLALLEMLGLKDGEKSHLGIAQFPMQFSTEIDFKRIGEAHRLAEEMYGMADKLIEWTNKRDEMSKHERSVK